MTGNKEAEIMYKNLMEKIDFEYGRYRKYLLLCSKSHLISNAYEVACKDAIYKRLKDDIKNERIKSETAKKMMLTDDVIDYMFMQINEKKLISLVDGCLDDIAWHRVLMNITF